MRATDQCTKCKKCVDFCPLGAVYFDEAAEEIRFDEKRCVNSMGCPAARICPSDAIERVGEYLKDLPEGYVRCQVCPIFCEIPPGLTGDCMMFMNKDGKSVPVMPLHTYEDVKDLVEPRREEEYDPAIRKPLITGIGAGMGWAEDEPFSMRTAPVIVSDNVDGVDVVTTASMPHIGYSSVIVKVYSAKYIGEEGEKIFYKGIDVGMIIYTGYDYDVIRIGGVRTNTRPDDGWVAGKVGADLANKKGVTLKTEKGTALELRVGYPPMIDGVVATATEGCGGCLSAEMPLDPAGAALFADGLVDEFIVIHRDYVGHWGEGAYSFEKDNWSGRCITGVLKSGIKPKGMSRYNWAHYWKVGKGWGLTDIEDPLDIIESYPSNLKEGFTLLITELDRRRYAVYKFRKGKWEKVTAHPRIAQVMKYMAEQTPPARIAVFMEVDCGGGARMIGVCGFPVSATVPPQVTKAVEAKKIKVTIGGADVWVVPGGGIELVLDVEKVPFGCIGNTPCGALVFPLEWTMKREDFRKLYHGPLERIKPLKEVLERLGKEK